MSSIVAGSLIQLYQNQYPDLYRVHHIELLDENLLCRFTMYGFLWIRLNPACDECKASGAHYCGPTFSMLNEECCAANGCIGCFAARRKTHIRSPVSVFLYTHVRNLEVYMPLLRGKVSTVMNRPIKSVPLQVQQMLLEFGSLHVVADMAKKGIYEYDMRNILMHVVGFYTDMDFCRNLSLRRHVYWTQRQNSTSCECFRVFEYMLVVTGRQYCRLTEEYILQRDSYEHETRGYLYDLVRNRHMWHKIVYREAIRPVIPIRRRCSSCLQAIQMEEELDKLIHRSIWGIHNEEELQITTSILKEIPTYEEYTIEQINRETIDNVNYEDVMEENYMFRMASDL